MYSEAELESAIAEGKLTREAANALREHVGGLRATPQADEEQLHMVVGFNDVFVALASILVFFAVGWITGSVAPWLGAVAVTAVAWGLAEFFTLKRKLAWTSIILVSVFVWGVYGIVATLTGGSYIQALSGGRLIGDIQSSGILFKTALALAVALGAAFLHWRRFQVPATVAMGMAVLVYFVLSLVVATVGGAGQWTLLLLLLMGVGVFSYALHWDMKDRERRTRQSDVAFWLHLVSAPMMIHPIFLLMGINVGGGFGGQDPSTGTMTSMAVLAVLIYLALGLVALIIDRRAVLVSALVYVLVAIVYLFQTIGVQSISIAFAALIIGSALLMLSAAWQSLRGLVVAKLPAHWQARLPDINRTAVGQR